METVTLSTKYQLVLPRRAREHLRLRPGMKFTVLSKGGVIFLIPERPMRTYRGVVRGVVRGTRARALREKKDRL
jgi:AbrB family looped-hinge helix DNA binding protein